MNNKMRLDGKTLVLVLTLVVSILVAFIGAVGAGNTDIAYAAPQSTTDEYGAVRTNMNEDYIPNIAIQNLYAPWSDTSATPKVAKGAKLINIADSNVTPLDLTNFGTMNADGVDGTQCTANTMSFDSTLIDNLHLHWQYFYGYIALPEILTREGGKLIVSAKQTSFIKKKQTAPDGSTFLSVTVGNDINGKMDNISPDDITMNRTTAKSISHVVDKAKSKTKGRNATNYADKIDVMVRPGDKYARISFVMLLNKRNSTKTQLFEQVLKDVVVKAETVSPEILDPQCDARMIIDGKETKAVTFAVPTNVKEVRDASGALLSKDVNGRYSVNVGAIEGTKVTLTFDNNTTKDAFVKATNVMKAGANAEILRIEPNQPGGYTLLVLKVTGAKDGEKVADPLIVGDAQLSNAINYGKVAEFHILYNTEVDNSQIIEANYEMMMVNITTNKVVNSVPYGKPHTMHADVPQGSEFIGWRDVHQTIVSTDVDFTFVPTRDITLNPKFVVVNTGDVMVTINNLAGHIMGKAVVASGLTDSEVIASVKNQFGSLKAPKVPFMKFNGWSVQTLPNGNKVMSPTYNAVGSFTVTIDGVSNANYHFNQHISLPATRETTGWRVNGKVVKTGNVGLDVFVTSDMTIEEIKTTTSEEVVRDVRVSEYSDNFGGKQNPVRNGYIVAGMLNASARYREVGFMFAKGTAVNTDNLVMENTEGNTGGAYVYTVPVRSITSTGQFIVAIDLPDYTDLKVRMYTIDANGTIAYSDIVPIVSTVA